MKVVAGIATLITAELALAAPYEVAGPKMPKPHECTGPMFRPGTQGDSHIWIDRVILAVP